MARHRNPLATPKGRQQSSVQIDQGKRPRGVSEAKGRRPLRRSARLKSERSEDAERQHFLPAEKTAQEEVRLAPPRSNGRKRAREIESPVGDIPPAPVEKRRRVSPADSTAKGRTDRESSVCGIEAPINPIDYWRREKVWPKEYFEPANTMSYLLAKRKSAPSLRRKRSESGALSASSTTPSDQKPREEKSAPYQDPRYSTLLETKGSYMDKSEVGITDATSRVFLDSLFHDDVFDKACRNLKDKNEARVIQDIARLIVPSAETAAVFGAKALEVLVESVNEGWNNSIPLLGSRLQPDYAVGFKRAAFTEDQLAKIKPILGDIIDMSFFMATYYMYFPFLMCEVKCGAAALDVADRQNAHSMTLAFRAVAELFRLVRREKEIDREILGFSVSHDHHSVAIYGHYPVYDGKGFTYYRHPIRSFNFTELDGKDKWTAYKFTKNVYDVWMPDHLDRIRSAINDVPSDFDFGLSQIPESGLSQKLESHRLVQSFTEPESPALARGSQSGVVDQGTTPDTSLMEREASKRPRREAAE
ncbi:hypothetical protein BDY21DRAFT_424709 [Lineolata rhizophorae]|uniref:DUF7924 domain-containing protein n=1 Tax=Lineolata rhizophorae TaxID=578093 RepID=A0A6A6NN40_9PEZI|nr:hypothetical protein BDY21DRAFT_424709 [Lineolata rhizophorae]